MDRYSFSDVEVYLNIYQQWKDIVVVHLKKGDLRTSSFNDMVEMLKQKSGLCLKNLTISNANGTLKLMQDIEALRKRNRRKNFLLILVGGFYKRFCSPDEMNFWKFHVYKNASYFKRIVALSPSKYSSGNLPFEWTVAVFNAVRYIFEEKHYDIEDMDLLQDHRNDPIYKTIQNDLKSYFAIFRFVLYTRNTISHAGLKHQRWTDLVTAINTLLEGNLRFNFGTSMRRLPFRIKNECYQPKCLPGYEKVFDEVSNGTTLWDEEIAYHCKPCKLNYIKPSYGDDRCQPCIGLFISNQQKTKCIDPLFPVHHKTSDTPGIITFAICSVGGVLCLLTMCIFIKNRETPIVRTSDFTISLVHLIAILMFFCSAPVSYFTTPTSGICMIRTLSISFFYILNIAITYTKSNKLVEAFSAKTRSTKAEVLKTTLMQAFAIFMNLLSACALVFALWSQQYPGIAVRLDIEQGEKFLYCNNGHDNIALSGLMLLLQLACFIQAFRCRNLPGHISDAMSIVYASFIVTVSLCVMFPIAFFQKNEENVDLVLVLVLSGNNMILFLSMYAKKLVIILFHSDKNTKEYFRRKQMEMIEKGARRI